MKTLLTLLLFLLQIPLSLAQEETSVRNSYVLRTGDVVEISVYQEEEDLNRTVVILDSGEASFRFIGAVNIEGLTLVEASEKIRKLYATDYIRYPRVNLTVTEYATEHVNVMGRVEAPGKVPLPRVGEGHLDLRSALAAAGGLTEMADRNKIQLRRVGGDVQTFSYQEIQSDGGKVILKGGDRIVVNESPFAGKFVSVTGEVGTPGRVDLPVDGELDIATALAKAGNLTEIADTEAITVIRKDGGKMSYSMASIQRGAASKVRLRGGDRVFVPKSRFADATVSVVGQVMRPGLIEFPLDGRLDILKAIAKAGGKTELANLKKVILSRPNQPKREINLIKLKNNGGNVIWLFPNDEVELTEGWW